MKIQISGTTTSPVSASAANAHTTRLRSTRGIASVSRATFDDVSDIYTALNTERLAPLLDRVGNTGLQSLTFIAIRLDLVDAFSSWRRDVRAKGIVVRLRHRLGVLLRVVEAFEQSCGVRMRSILHDPNRRDDQNCVVGRKLHVDRVTGCLLGE